MVTGDKSGAKTEYEQAMNLSKEPQLNVYCSNALASLEAKKSESTTRKKVETMTPDTSSSGTEGSTKTTRLAPEKYNDDSLPDIHEPDGTKSRVKIKHT
jgi:hypothetical protein